MGGGMKKTNFVASVCPHMGICKVWAGFYTLQGEKLK